MSKQQARICKNRLCYRNSIIESTDVVPLRKWVSLACVFTKFRIFEFFEKVENCRTRFDVRLVTLELHACASHGVRTARVAWRVISFFFFLTDGLFLLEGFLRMMAIRSQTVCERRYRQRRQRGSFPLFKHAQSERVADNKIES